MKKIAFLTTTRAEFGILKPLMIEMNNCKDIQTYLFVGGTHLSDDYGSTISEINDCGFKIDNTFDYLTNDYNSFSLLKGLARATEMIAVIFDKYDFDMICIVGDRYELLSIIANAIVFKKAIIHIHGGERTEGAIDEQIRHMVTKAAHLHFSSCEEYAKNICRMGEESWRVHNVGALAVDNIVRSEKIPSDILFSELEIERERPLVILTYHPVTLEFNLSPEAQIGNIFEALSSYDFQVLITSPNVELDRDKILNIIKQKVFKNPSYRFIHSLGSQKYHSLIPYCEFVIGNSSSGIIEVPNFKIPTINVGSRQNGRFRHPSILDTNYSVESIRKSIETARSNEFRKEIQSMKYEFGNGNAAKSIVDIINSIEINEKLLQKKLIFID